jgi:hypothetical protein
MRRTIATNFFSIAASIFFYVVVILVVVVVPDNVFFVTATRIRGSSSSNSSPLLDEDYLSNQEIEEEAHEHEHTTSTSITSRKSTLRRLQNPKASEENGISSSPSPIPTKGEDYDPSKRDAVSSSVTTSSTSTGASITVDDEQEVDETEEDDDGEKEMWNTNIVKKTKEIKNRNAGILPMTRWIGSRYINGNDTNNNPRKALLKQADRGPTKLITTATFTTILPNKIGDLREPIEVMADTATQTRSVGNARIAIIGNNDTNDNNGIIKKVEKKSYNTSEKDSKKKLVKKDYEMKKYIKNNDKKSKGDGDRKERLKMKRN